MPSVLSYRQNAEGTVTLRTIALEVEPCKRPHGTKITAQSTRLQVRGGCDVEVAALLLEEAAAQVARGAVEAHALRRHSATQLGAQLQLTHLVGWAVGWLLGQLVGWLLGDRRWLGDGTIGVAAA